MCLTQSVSLFKIRSVVQTLWTYRNDLKFTLMGSGDPNGKSKSIIVAYYHYGLFNICTVWEGKTIYLKKGYRECYEDEIVVLLWWWDSEKELRAKRARDRVERRSTYRPEERWRDRKPAAHWGPASRVESPAPSTLRAPPPPSIHCLPIHARTHLYIAKCIWPILFRKTILKIEILRTLIFIGWASKAKV